MVYNLGKKRFTDQASKPGNARILRLYRHQMVRIDFQNSLGAGTSSTSMDAGTTSFSKDIEHRKAYVGLGGNNLELAGNGARTAGSNNTL